MLSQHRLAIDANDDSGSLHDKLAALGAEAIVTTLAEVARGRARPVPQPEAGAVYAPKISPREAQIDWGQSCVQIERKLRALRPSPGARTLLRGEALKLWRASCSERSGAPGTVLAAGATGLLVACGEGALQVSELQRAGGKRLAAAEFLRGCAIAPGECLGAAR